MSALVLTAAGNAYARWAQRPGALVRVPGIILMVPGSASVRSVLTLIQPQDLAAGQQAALAVVNILLALIAGLLFGNLLLPTRRNLCEAGIRDSGFGLRKTWGVVGGPVGAERG